MGEEKIEGINKEEEGEKQQAGTSTKKEEEKAGERVVQKSEEDDKVVLKVDMHCEACARKVVRALNGFQGVEEVTADYKSSRVVVKGRGATADPLKVSQRIQNKTGHRKVEIISPLPLPLPLPLPAEPNPKPKEDQPPKQDKNEQEPPALITVVLNVQMHCGACAQVMQKRIRKVKGVESVMADIANNKVTVKGIIDPDKLVKDVYKRTRKHALIVRNEEKKEEEKKAEVKPEEKKHDEEGKEEDEVKADMKYWPQRNYMEYAYAPHIFSDDNPNACFVM